jgi:hypothetical protein
MHVCNPSLRRLLMEDHQFDRRITQPRPYLQFFFNLKKPLMALHCPSKEFKLRSVTFSQPTGLSYCFSASSKL